jgi:hypothetical protein
LDADKHEKLMARQVAGFQRIKKRSWGIKCMAAHQACCKPISILFLHDILDPRELCLPLPTGTGKSDIRLALPFMARTLLGRVMVRRDKGLEFGSAGRSSSLSLSCSISSR